MSISYDGTAYNGFQSQPNRNTIQDKLEDAIVRLTGEQVKVIGSGRTDAGVHARRQVVNFLTQSAIPADRWPLALNSRLPDDIVVLAADEVPLAFHARKDAKRKTYCYHIRHARYPDVFGRRYEYHHYGALDMETMRAALEHIKGTHDFTSFCSVHSAGLSRVRTIYDARIDFTPSGEAAETGREGLIRIFLTGNGFLYNMVRIIVGTLLMVGEGKMAPERMRDILAARDRALAGPTAMAHGLMLWDVEYT
jgi:tRNA pseudouridine38-40 synthase